MRWHQESRLIINVSKKKWVEGESQGVELGWEGNTDGDTDLDKAYEEKFADLNALAEKFLNGQPTAGGFTEPEMPFVKPVAPTQIEEKPPLPSGNVPDNWVTPDGTSVKGIAEGSPAEVRTPVDDAGEDLEGFIVKFFVIDVSDSGTKVAKTFGGRVMKHGATAWPEVIDTVYGDIQDLDKGHKFDPPYPIKAWCTKSAGGWPNKVVSFEKA